MTDQHHKEARFWRTIRRALLLIARAIDERYPDRAADRTARKARAKY